MPLKSILYVFVFVLMSSTSYTFANSDLLLPQLKFTPLTIKQGLSQSYVYDIVEDHQGFMWVATQEGLNRYDGNEFVHYKNNILIENSVANNFIRKVFVDKSNTLWVGTQNGLSKYNHETDSFENFYHDKHNTSSLQDNVIWDIYQDKADTLWVTTTEGVHHYSPKTNQFNRIKIRNHENKLKEIKTVFQDDQNNYWLGTYENGIYIVGEDLSGATSLQAENKWGLSIDASRLSDIVIVDNDYWLATDKGVYIVDKNYQLKKHFDVTPNTSLIASNNVISIVQLDDTEVWIGTRNGLTTYNLHNQKSNHHKSNNYEHSLVNNTIYNLFQDSSNKVWIGTDGGINIFSPVSMNFKHFTFKQNAPSQIVDSLLELPNGAILLARGDGALFQIHNNKISKLPIHFEDNVFNLLLQSSDSIIVHTQENRLFEYNFITQQLTAHETWNKSSKMPNESGLSLANNTLWFINANKNLESYDLTNQQFSTYDNTQKLTSFSIDTEIPYEQSYIWATSINNTITKFSLKTQTFENVDLIETNDYFISNSKNIIKSGEWLWLSSFDQGLMLYNIDNKAHYIFNDNNQLINNTINGIFIDEESNAWFSTNKGISSINPYTLSVINYAKQFGIENNEFIDSSILYSKKRVAYFGGLNGFHTSHISEISTIEQHMNAPVLTNLLIANKKVEISNTGSVEDVSNDKFVLEKQLNNTETLILEHEQSPFSIEFVSPNAKISNQIKYRYRLQGLEDEWINTDIFNRRATYTNLDAGTYTFQVQVINLLSTQKNNSKTKNIKITIMPPWWFSLLSLLVVVYLILQMRQKRLSHTQIMLSEERLKLSLWGSGDEMWDWNITNGKIFRSNIWEILEFPQDGKRSVGAENTNIHQSDLPRVRQALTDHFDKKTNHFETTYRVKDKNGRWIWVLDRGKIVKRDEHGAPARMTGTLKDISQIKRADERLKLFAKCIENISDAVFIFDRQFTIIDINKAYQRITQISKKDILGKSLRFEQYPESFTQNVKKHLITKGGWHGEIENKDKNGHIYIIDLNIDIIKDESNHITHFVGVFSDVTERKKNEAELRKLANSDTLTGLPNRSYFQANQNRLVKTKVPHALLVFDLDNFKKINDSMGHGVGDALLCKVAQRIVASNRKQDTVYRLGGDEFSIIIENTNDIHTITTIAKNILKTIAQPMKLKEQEVVLYSSIGIALFPEDGASSQELLKNADTAMYHAKNSGGNKYQFFSESMNKQAVKRLQIESLIRHGLKEDYFSVFYQPKIEISTGKIAGMEALVRFETPSKGIISPVVFIPVSEETGQIIDIGEIVLRKSCIATKKWVDAGLFEGRIAVNLSAVQFTQPNLVGMITDILKESELPAKHLELEITEGTVMDSPQQAIDTMLQIRAMGIHLSLDDFGTGYSSLAYLKKFPLNTLKIDKAFVDDIEVSEQGRNMVATIVTIAHNLGLHVVAEGVETSQQLSFLSGLRCEQLQGYLYSKPLPENDFQKYLISHQITDNSTSFHRM